MEYKYADLAAKVTTSGGNYDVWVGWGILPEVGERVKRIFSPNSAYVISDAGVKQHAESVQKSMTDSDIPTHIHYVKSGEANKTLETVTGVYSWLAQNKAERGDLVLAVGGGMVGDLAGFVAATYLRGMPFAQVPTTLLSMMDASIGGKVAVDLPQGKNLVGAFYQPRFVLSDVETLITLPKRELVSGWAEAIKHGLILDGGLLEKFETDSEQITSLNPNISTDIIRRSVAIKAGIVSKDEKETKGIRILLNYGHTIGHALESTSGYSKFLHGEAVSVGMMGAAEIGCLIGTISEQDVLRQRSILSKYGLPVSLEDVDSDKLLHAMKSDKKTSGGAIRWVLLDGIGKAITNHDVPENYVRDALSKLVY